MSYARFAVLLAGILVVFAGVESSQQIAKYSVSIPDLKVANGERVVSLEIDIRAGAVESVSNIPVGWNFVIDNDPSWQPKITATTIVGGASLTPSDLKKIQFTVRKNEFGDLKFGL